MGDEEQAVLLESLSKREQIRLFREYLNMPPFMAKSWADFLQKISLQARELPPYSLLMVWDPDDEIFVVTVPELPGCRTHGTTYEEAAAMRARRSPRGSARRDNSATRCPIRESSGIRSTTTIWRKWWGKAPSGAMTAGGHFRYPATGAGGRREGTGGERKRA